MEHVESATCLLSQPLAHSPTHQPTHPPTSTHPPMMMRHHNFLESDVVPYLDDDALTLRFLLLVSKDVRLECTPAVRAIAKRREADATLHYEHALRRVWWLNEKKKSSSLLRYTFLFRDPLSEMDAMAHHVQWLQALNGSPSYYAHAPVLFFRRVFANADVPAGRMFMDSMKTLLCGSKWWGDRDDAVAVAGEGGCECGRDDDEEHVTYVFDDELESWASNERHFTEQYRIMCS